MAKIRNTPEMIQDSQRNALQLCGNLNRALAPYLSGEPVTDRRPLVLVMAEIQEVLNSLGLMQQNLIHLRIQLNADIAAIPEPQSFGVASEGEAVFSNVPTKG